MEDKDKHLLNDSSHWADQSAKLPIDSIPSDEYVVTKEAVRI